MAWKSAPMRFPSSSHGKRAMAFLFMITIARRASSGSTRFLACVSFRGIVMDSGTSKTTDIFFSFAKLSHKKKADERCFFFCS